MIIAQLPPPTNVDFGSWMIGAVAAMGILYLALKIFREIFPREPVKAVPDQPATHGEIESLKTQAATRGEMEAVKTQFATFATRQEVERLEKDIARLDDTVQCMQKETRAALEQMKADTRQSLHRLADSINPIMLKLTRMDVVLKLIAAKNGIVAEGSDEMFAIPKGGTSP